MASLYIAEFDSLPLEYYQRTVPATRLVTLAEQVVSIGGSSTQSAAFNTLTRWIEIHPDATCSIAGGSNPTATTSNRRLKQDERVYLAVNGGDKIAVITNT